MGSLRTYLVEDSPVIRENLIAALEEMVSVEVVGSASGEDAAVQWLEDTGNRCDVMIVDVFLEQGSGLGVLRAAQRRDRLTKLEVLSNYATAYIHRKCLELGADRALAAT